MPMIIPKEAFYSTKLTPVQKLIYCQITTGMDKNNIYWPELSIEQLNYTYPTIENAIKALRLNKFIENKITRVDQDGKATRLRTVIKIIGDLK